jgi:hypothetical protein
MIHRMTSQATPRPDHRPPARRVAFADISVELTLGGARIPLPAVPFLPTEPPRAPVGARRRGRPPAETAAFVAP